MKVIKSETVKADQLREERINQQTDKVINEFSKLTDTLNDLPKDISEKLVKSINLQFDKEIELSNFDDLLVAIHNLQDEIKNKPVTTSVSIENANELVQDNTKLLNTLDKLSKVTNELAKKELKVVVNQTETTITFPKKAQDAIPVVLVTKDKRDFYEALTSVISGGSIPNIGGAVPVVNPDGTKLLNGLVNFEYDYISVDYPDSVTEVYAYKLGGASGVTKGTITVVYTDSTKENISTVART